MANIKQILVSGATYDVEALHFVTGSLDTPAQWKEYIDSLVGQGLQIVMDDPNTAGNAPKTTASASTMGKLYLVTLTGQLSGTYTEFVTVKTGTASPYTYNWEKIGTTEADLSSYVKIGNRTTAGPSTDATGSAGAQTASVDISAIKYDKANGATGSSGAHTHTVTGKVTAAGTISKGTGTANYTPTGSVSQPTFSDGSAASAGAHTHNVTAAGSISAAASSTGNYTPAGSVANHSHSMGATSSTTTIVTAQGTLSKGTLPALTIANETVAVTSATQAFSVVTGVTGGTASGTTTVNKSYTHSDPQFNTQTVVTSVTGASASGTTTAITGLPNFTGGSLTGDKTFIKSLGTPSTSNFNTNASRCYMSTITPTLLVIENAGTGAAVVGYTPSPGTVGYTAASLGDLSTASVVTGVSGGVAATTASVLRNVKTAGGITSGGTTTVVTGVTAASASGTQTLTPTSIGSASGWSAGSLPSLGAATTTTLTYISAVDANTGNKQPAFTGTKVQLSFTGSAVNTNETGGHTHTVTGTVSQPTFTGTGVELKFTGSEVNLTGGSAAEAGAHTHSVTTTSTAVTGSASAAVSNHTHTLSNHTHSINLQHNP